MKKMGGQGLTAYCYPLPSTHTLWPHMPTPIHKNIHVHSYIQLSQANVYIRPGVITWMPCKHKDLKLIFITHVQIKQTKPVTNHYNCITGKAEHLWVFWILSLNELRSLRPVRNYLQTKVETYRDLSLTSSLCTHTHTNICKCMHVHTQV